MRPSVAIFLSAFLAGVIAEDFTVKVGDGGLVFNPPSVNAKNGDTIAFQFVAKNHSVTQSTFANPCSQQGIGSGFQLVPAGSTSFPQWSFTMNNDTSPLWFFCAQTDPVNHCQMGMVFAVNPTPEKSIDAFKANAMGAAANVSGSSVAASATATGTGAFPTLSGFATVASSGAPSGSGPLAASTAATTPANAAVSFRSGSVSALALAGLVAGLWL